MRLGRIYHQTFKHIVSTLYDHYKGSDYDWLFSGTFYDRVHVYEPFQVKAPTWNPPCLKTPHIQCLKTIAHYTIGLMKNTRHLPDNISLALCCYFDAHAPLMCAVEDHAHHMTEKLARKLAQTYDPEHAFIIHESNLPDVNHKLLHCSFWDEQKVKPEPIVHLLIKSLPQRCQIRNLQAIITSYTQKDDLVYEFMRIALLCTLLGTYTHVRKRPQWMARKQIIRRFIYDSPNRMQLQQWVFSVYQHLLFYTVKEYITFAMKFIPSLEEVIRKTYNWKAFESSVFQSMDQVRMMFETNLYASQQLASWFERIEPMLVHVNKQQLCNLYRPQRQTFAQAVMQLCEKIDEGRQHPNPRVAFDMEYRTFLRELFKRYPRTNTVPVEWLRAFRVSSAVIDKMNNMQRYFHQNTFRTELRKTLTALPRYEFEAIRDLFEVFEQTHQKIRCFPLPQHHYEKQMKALRLKYGIKEGEDLPSYAGLTYVCLVCNAFKGFVIKPSDSSHANLFASGHAKIIVDDDTLKCYCGRRCDKNDSKKKRKRSTTQNTRRTNKKEFKNKRKQFMNERCATTECLAFNMTGMLLQFYDNLYTFCTSCAGVTIFHPDHYTSEGIVCGHCTQNGVFFTNIKCGLCGVSRGKDAWETLPILKEKGLSADDDDNIEIISVCKSCYQPWMQDIREPLTLEECKSNKKS